MAATATNPDDPTQPLTDDTGAPLAPVEPPSGTPFRRGPHLEVEKLQAKPTRELKIYAKKEYEIENAATLKKHDLVCEILKRNAAKNGTANGGGVLDLSPRGLRISPLAAIQLYHVSRGSLCLAFTGAPLWAAQRRCALRSHPRTEGEWNAILPLARVDTIEGQAAEEGRVRPTFDLLTPDIPESPGFFSRARRATSRCARWTSFARLVLVNAD